MRLIALLRTLRLSIKSTQWSVRRSSRRKGWLRSSRRSLLSKRPGESKWTSGSKTRWRSSRRSRKLSLILSMPIVRWKTGGGIRVLRQNAWLRTRSMIWCQRDLSLSQPLPMGSLLAHRWRESSLKKLVFCLARSRRAIWRRRVWCSTLLPSWYTRQTCLKLQLSLLLSWVLKKPPGTWPG